MCGKLVKSMYGTRDVAQNWEEEHTEFMTDNKLVRGLGSPCVFFNEDRGLRAVIHGDDFTISGKEKQLNWFKEKIKEKFVVKFKARLGPEDDDGKSVRVLNRVIEWSDKGISYEPDQRHAELIVASVSVETCRVNRRKRKRRHLQS